MRDASDRSSDILIPFPTYVIITLLLAVRLNATEKYPERLVV